MATNKTKTALVTQVGTALPIGTSAGITATNHSNLVLDLIETLFGAFNVTTVTAASPSFDIDVTRFLRCNTASNTITVPLPDATTYAGRTCGFKKTHASNNMVLDPAGSDTIEQSDGSFNTALTLTGVGDTVWLIAVGTTWEIYASHSL